MSGIVKFVTSYGGVNNIRRVEVIRETNACVYLPSMTRTSGRRDPKRGTFAQYHDTWEAAHAYLVEQAEIEVNAARRQLEKVSGKLANIKGMPVGKVSK